MKLSDPLNVVPMEIKEVFLIALETVKGLLDSSLLAQRDGAGSVDAGSKLS